MRLNAAFVIVLGIALATVTVPVGTADQGSVREQNRGWLIDRIDGWDPDEPVVHDMGDRVEVIPAREALDRILDRLDRFDVDLTDAFEIPTVRQGHTEGPAKHTAGSFLLFELNLGGVGCEGVTYKARQHVGGPGVPIVGGPYDAVAAASSNVTTGEFGAGRLFVHEGQLQVLDEEIPTDQGYANDVVRYEGNVKPSCSDFGSGSTINIPFFRGTFGPVVGPSP